MADSDKEKMQNMCKYVFECVEGDLSKTSLVLLDILNKTEILKSLVQKSLNDIKNVIIDMKSDFDIINKS